MRTQIVRLDADHANLLDRIAEDVFDDAVDPARAARYLAEPGHMMVLALSGGEVVGQARGMVHRHPDGPTELYIDNLGVTPSRRREGLATRMLDELVGWGAEQGCEEAWVGTEAGNGPARALYEGRGAQAETFVMYVYELATT